MAQFKRKDGYALMTLVVKELTGQDIGNIVDTAGLSSTYAADGGIIVTC